METPDRLIEALRRLLTADQFTEFLEEVAPVINEYLDQRRSLRDLPEVPELAGLSQGDLDEAAIALCNTGLVPHFMWDKLKECSTREQIDAQVAAAQEALELGYGRIPPP